LAELFVASLKFDAKDVYEGKKFNELKNSNIGDKEAMKKYLANIWSKEYQKVLDFLGSYHKETGDIEFVISVLREIKLKDEDFQKKLYFTDFNGKAELVKKLASISDAQKKGGLK